MNQPPQLVLAAAIDLGHQIDADLAQLARTRALRPRLPGRHDELLERLARQRVQVGDVVRPAPGRRADRRWPRPAPRCSSRSARRSARGCAADAPDSCRVSQRQTTSPSAAHERAAARRTGAAASARARPGRAGPASSTRDDLRDDVAALFDHDAVAEPDVLARDLVGVVQRGHWRWSTRPAAPARARPPASPRRCARPAARCPSSRVVACCAGNLKAMAQRGNFDVVAQPLAIGERVHLDRRRRRSRSRGRDARRASGRRTRSAPRCRRAARQCCSTGSPQSARVCRSIAGVRLGTSSSRRADRPRRSARARATAADRAAAGRRPPRCAGWQTAARPPLRAPG